MLIYIYIPFFFSKWKIIFAIFAGVYPFNTFEYFLKIRNYKFKIIYFDFEI